MIFKIKLNLTLLIYNKNEDINRGYRRGGGGWGCRGIAASKVGVALDRAIILKP